MKGQDPHYFEAFVNKKYILKKFAAEMQYRKCSERDQSCFAALILREKKEH